MFDEFTPPPATPRWLPWLGILAFVLCILSLAQCPAAHAQPTSVVIGPTTVAALPSAVGRAGRIALVTDSNSTTSCAAGGGTNKLICQSDGTNWNAIGSGAGFGGTYSAATPAVFEQTATGAQDGFEWQQDGVKRLAVEYGALGEVYVTAYDTDGTTPLGNVGFDPAFGVWLGSDVSGQSAQLYALGGNVMLGDECFAEDTGRIFENLDCDSPPVKDAGEEYIGLAGGAGGAPATADYIVGTADAGLSGELVCTDTATVDCDIGTAGQAKWNVIASGLEASLEALIDLQDLQGAVTDSQVPDTVTIAGGAVNLETSTLTNILDDEIPVGTGAGTATFVAVQNCDDTTGKLDWNGTAFVCNTDQTAAGGSGDVTAVGDCTTGACFDGTAGNALQFEGATADGFEASLTTLDDPTEDKTISLPTKMSGRLPVVFDRRAAAQTNIDNTSSPTFITMTEVAGGANGGALIEGGALGSTGKAILRCWGDFFNNSAANRTYTIDLYWGGSAILTVTTGNLSASTARRAWWWEITVNALNSTSSQWVQMVGSQINAAPASVATGTGAEGGIDIAAQISLNMAAPASVDTASDAELAVRITLSTNNASLEYIVNGCTATLY